MNGTKPELRWTPFEALFRKELRRFWRVFTQTVLIPLINSSLYLLIFGVSLGNKIRIGEGLPYIAFLIPGLVMMGVLNNAFQNASSSIGTSKFHGDLEDLRVVPLVPWQIVWALSLAGLIRGIIVGIITFGIGEFFYRLSQHALLSIAHPVVLAFFLVLGGLSFSQLGIIISFRAKNFDQLSAVGGFILLPLMYLGGVFFPLHGLAPFWQNISKANPLLYFINGVRFGVLGAADIRWSLAALFSSLTLVLLYWYSLVTVKNGTYHRW